MYWCLSAQSFACVCSLSQPGGVCKAEWCPFVCVLSKSVCGEEYRGKVYALLVSTPGASQRQVRVSRDVVFDEMASSYVEEK